MRYLTTILASICTLVLALSSVDASTITLSIQTPTASTWNVYASSSNDCDGLSSFAINVIGSGGATVTGSTMVGPRGVDLTLLDIYGFYQYSNGTNGINITGGQHTVYDLPNDPNKDALVLLDLGITPGSHYASSWDAPIRIATGTFTGSSGILTVSVGNGQFNVLDNNWTGPGNVSQADVVIGDSTSVPEPMTLGLLASGCALLLRRRRGA